MKSETIFENCYERVGFSKVLLSETHEKKRFLLLANKFIEKVPNRSNGRQHYQSFIGKKSTK